MPPFYGHSSSPDKAGETVRREKPEIEADKKEKYGRGRRVGIEAGKAGMKLRGETRAQIKRIKSAGRLSGRVG